MEKQVSEWSVRLFERLQRHGFDEDFCLPTLDAAAEEYHEALIGEIREKLVEYWGESARNSLDKFTAKRVLDKLGRG